MAFQKIAMLRALQLYTGINTAYHSKGVLFQLARVQLLSGALIDKIGDNSTSGIYFPHAMLLTVSGKQGSILKREIPSVLDCNLQDYRTVQCPREEDISSQQTAL